MYERSDFSKTMSEINLKPKAKNRKSVDRGFTLIELIITVAILAILVSIVVVALNPAEQLQRARDARRIADLDAIKTSLNLYLAQATGTINMSGDSTPNNRCVGGAGTDTTFANSAGATDVQGLVAIATSTGQSVATSAPVTVGVSWMPALIGVTPGGSPLSNLPVDPTNSATRYYSYTCGPNNAYELNARLESSYYSTETDLDGTDGGNNAIYEVGTNLSLMN